MSGAGTAGKARPLGINASIASALRPKGAEVEQFSGDDRAKFNRLLRWQRQSAARDLLKDERVSKCIWVRVLPLVEVWKSRDLQKPNAYYKGLYTCGSVWMCPVCAAKITERRRIELQEVIDASHEIGELVFMVTLTMQHTKRDKYAEITQAIRDAWREVRSGRGWQRIKQEFEIVGVITSLEFTCSLDNGGHPHFHVLMFSKCKKISADSVRDLLSSRYTEILKGKKLKRYASAEHGVKVQIGDAHVGDYVAKFGSDKESTWGLAAEMTKGAVKSAGLKHGEHYTPFQLLDASKMGDKQAGKMFQEYAQAFKGKHQIGGLSQQRKRLGLSQAMSDEEIAEAGQVDAFRMLGLIDQQWAKIRRGGMRGMLLEVVRDADYETVSKYLHQRGVYVD